MTKAPFRQNFRVCTRDRAALTVQRVFVASCVETLSAAAPRVKYGLVITYFHFLSSTERQFVLERRTDIREANKHLAAKARPLYLPSVNSTPMLFIIFFSERPNDLIDVVHFDVLFITLFRKNFYKIFRTSCNEL